MQMLIELLAKYIRMDLSHIKGKSLLTKKLILKGKKIVRGHHNHLFNLL